MTTSVVGASGATGKHLVEQLLESGQIPVVHNEEGKNNQVLEDRFRLLLCDQY